MVPPLPGHQSEQAQRLTLKGAWQLCSTAMTASLTVCVPFSERLVRPTAMEMLEGRETGPSLATCSLQEGNCHGSELDAWSSDKVRALRWPPAPCRKTGLYPVVRQSKGRPSVGRLLHCRKVGMQAVSSARQVTASEVDAARPKQQGWIHM